MKNKIIMVTLLTSVLLSTTSVYASGSAKVNFTSSDYIKVGDTFTVSMNVTDINDTYDGVVSMGGNLSFDSNMIEYISSKGIKTPYLFQINEVANYKIAGLDFTLNNGIRDTMAVYEFTFKALQPGNTTITLKNAKLTDSKDYINTIVIPEKIVISKEDTSDVLQKNSEEFIVEKIVIENDKIISTKQSQTTEKNNKAVVENSIKKNSDEEETKTNNDVNYINSEIKQSKQLDEMPLIDKIQKVFNGIIENLKKLFR